jgi:hypothetical protein
MREKGKGTYCAWFDRARGRHYFLFNTDGSNVHRNPFLRDEQGNFYVDGIREPPSSSVEDFLKQIHASARVHPDSPFRTILFVPSSASSPSPRPGRPSYKAVLGLRPETKSYRSFRIMDSASVIGGMGVTVDALPDPSQGKQKAVRVYEGITKRASITPKMVFKSNLTGEKLFTISQGRHNREHALAVTLKQGDKRSVLSLQYILPCKEERYLAKTCWGEWIVSCSKTGRDFSIFDAATKSLIGNALWSKKSRLGSKIHTRNDCYSLHLNVENLLFDKELAILVVVLVDKLRDLERQDFNNYVNKHGNSGIIASKFSEYDFQMFRKRRNYRHV